MKILLAIMSAMMFVSCATDQCGPTKEKFLANYERFVDKIESKELTPDKEAWKSLDQKFDKYLTECYTEFENDLSSQERIDFASNTVRYYYTKYGKGLSEQLGSDPEEFARVMTKNLENFMHGHEDDIEALVEEFANRIDREEMEELIEKGADMFETLLEDLEN